MTLRVCIGVCPQLPITWSYALWFVIPCRWRETRSRRGGGEENQTPMLKRDGDPGTPPTTLERTGYSQDLSQEEEPEDLLFVTPPEGDRPSGTAKDELTKAEGKMNGNFLEQLDELVASQSQLTPAETPAGTRPQPPAGPDAPMKAYYHLMEMRNGSLQNLSQLQPVRRPRVPQPKNGMTLRFHHSSGASR